MILRPSQKFSKLLQPEKGYRYNIDSFLLMRFAKLFSQDRVCDLGAGVGILGLLALEVYQVQSVLAVEIQQELAELAKKNAQLFTFKERYQVLCEKWQNLKSNLAANCFEVVLSNPPYRKIQTGRLAPDLSKAIARHELRGCMQSLIKIAQYLLTQEGRLYLMYPPLRLEELIVTLAQFNLKIQRMSFVHAYQDAPAKLVMLEIIKASQREIIVEPPLIVYQSPDQYHPQIEEWVGPKLKTKESL